MIAHWWRKKTTKRNGQRKFVQTKRPFSFEHFGTENVEYTLRLSPCSRNFGLIRIKRAGKLFTPERNLQHVIIAHLYVKEPTPEALYALLSMCHIPHSQVKSVRRQKHLMSGVIDVLACQIPSTECYQWRVALRMGKEKSKSYFGRYSYSGTPPYGHFVNTVTSLLRQLCFVPAKRPYIVLIRNPC